MAISQAEPLGSSTVAQGDVAHGLVADLAIDDGADEHLAGVRLERVEVDVPAAQPRPVAVERGQPVGVDEDAAALHFGDEADDPRQPPVGCPARRRCPGSARSLRRRRRAAATASRGTRRSARRPWPRDYCCDRLPRRRRRARTSTRVSKKATPPPQSVSVSLVRALAARPSGCWSPTSRTGWRRRRGGRAH